jgi:hypothetical protein
VGRGIEEDGSGYAGDVGARDDRNPSVPSRSSDDAVVADE